MDTAKKSGRPHRRCGSADLNNEGINGKTANRLTGLADKPEPLNDLGVALMHAHVKAVQADMADCKGNVPGLLSPTQVAKYHLDVFEEKGIGSWLFGGTLFNLPPDLYRPIWCGKCDFLD